MHLKRIDSVEELHGYLQAALQMEHSTIPPYLTALYSIHPSTNADASSILHTVVVEEMLHLMLVANIMNAVGGTPDLTVAGFVPDYPTHLPDGETDFEVGIGPLSPATLQTFLHIERPGTATDAIDFVERARSPRALLPGFRDDAETELHFYSIGEFYQEVHRGLNWLHEDTAARGGELFVGDPARQVTPTFRYSGGGEIVAVTDLPSANAAIRLICEQGEGRGGAIYDEEDELSHYYRFEQLVLGRYYQPGDVAGQPSGPPLDVDWTAVYPVAVNARLSDYPEGSELRAAAMAFNSAYQGLLGLLTQALGGRPEMLDPAVGAMFQLNELAHRLVQLPIPGSAGVNGAPIYREPA